MAETQAIVACSEALDQLETDEQRKRVLSYLAARYGGFEPLVSVQGRKPLGDDHDAYMAVLSEFNRVARTTKTAKLLPKISRLERAVEILTMNHTEQEIADLWEEVWKSSSLVPQSEAEEGPARATGDHAAESARNEEG